MRNPLTMNDWDLKKTLFVTAVLQVALLGSAGLNALGVPLLIIQQVTGCIFLLFIPGILLLRVLKLHSLGSVATPLYAVGLSIATLMFSGILIDLAYPYLGITRPIAALPLLITLSALVDVLCLAAFVRDKAFSGGDSLELRAVVSPSTLALCLIPFISIFGTYVMNGTGNNTVLLLLIVLIAALVVIVTFKKGVPAHVYPLAVFVSALSLFYYNSLISSYVSGWDINSENYLAGLVVANGSWSPTMSINYLNSALSDVLLAPTLSLVCGLSIVSVFKVVFPLLFALVPVGAYLAFRQQTNEKIAFLSAFLLLAVEQTFTDMMQLPRQEIGELFLVLMILLFIDKSSLTKNSLSIIFAFALVVSCFSLAYLYLFLAIFVLLAVALLDNRTAQRIARVLQSRPAVNNLGAKNTRTARRMAPRAISLVYVALVVAFSQLMFIYTSGGLIFYSALLGLNSIVTASPNFFNVSTTGAGVVTRATTSPLYDVAKDLHLFVQFLIVVGLVVLLLGRTRARFNKEFAAFAVGAFLMLIATLAVPFVAGQLNASRFYQIGLIWLAPFAVIGALAIARALGYVVRSRRTSSWENGFLKAFSIFLALFLLFNSGFIYATVNNSVSTAIPLNATFDAPRFYDREVAGAAWLGHEKTNQAAYADKYRSLLLDNFLLPASGTIGGNLTLPSDSYGYVGTLNIETATLTIVSLSANNRIYVDDHSFTNGSSRLYDNGGAQVYYKQ